MKAIIPAAGLGTRFLPATRCMPKELLPVLDKPILQYVVEEALEPEGVDGVVIVNSREKPQIEQWSRYLRNVSVCDSRVPDRACPQAK